MIVVPLGLHGGEITLTQLEDSSYALDGMPISNGHSVTGTNGHQYRLFLAEDEWFAAPIVATISILLPNSQGNITVLRFEDGTYSYNGAAVASGDPIMVGAIEYVLDLDGFESMVSLSGAMPPPETSRVRPVDDEGNTLDTLQTFIGVQPRLVDSEGSGLLEGGFMSVGGKIYPLDTLFTEGSVRQQRTFADNARSDINGWLTSLEVLLDLYEPAATGGLGGDIEDLWDRIGERLDQLFPDSAGTLLDEDTPKRSNGTTIDRDDVLDDINEILDALDGVEQLEDALDDGILSDASVEQARVEEIFSAAESSEELGFGWTGNTRFGAYFRAARLEGEEALSLQGGTEGLGTFAYSPLDRSPTIQLPSSGTASYRGETVAASGSGDFRIYRGPIEFDVDFRSRRVAGRVLFLEDSDGAPWIYGGNDLDSLLLPAARISVSDGSFSSAEGSAAIADLIPFFGSLQPLALDAQVRGRFLGSGSDAGQAAIGTWELTDDDAILLSGAFGAESRSTIRSGTPPVIPDTGDPQTSFIAMPDASQQIEIAALDSDGDQIQISADTLMRNGSITSSGERFFAAADRMIRQHLRVLDVVEQVGDTSVSLRTSLWSNANRALRENIFGPRVDAPLGRDYPQGDSIRAQDRDAVAALGDVLTALRSPAEFRQSLTTGGVFEGLLGSESALADLDFAAIFDASDYDLEVQFGHSSFTRFGAWAKIGREYATGPIGERPATDEYSDIFAYSTVRQTGYHPRDPNFPSGFTSTYAGQTRGVQRGSGVPQFFFGDMVVTVQWGGSAAASSVSAAILNLADNAGQPFAYRGAAVSEIVFSGQAAEIDSTSGLGFSGSPAIQLSYADSTRSGRGYVGTRQISGKFLGKQSDGPVGVIGTWELGDIKGAYGAEIVP